MRWQDITTSVAVRGGYYSDSHDGNPTKSPVSHISATFALKTKMMPFFLLLSSRDAHDDMSSE